MLAKTESELFTSLTTHLRLCEEASYILGHWYKAQNDFEKGRGFLAVGEMFKLTLGHVTNLAIGKLDMSNAQ